MSDLFPSSVSFGRRPDIHGGFLGLFGLFAGTVPDEDTPVEAPAPKPEPEYECDFARADSCFCHIDPPCSFCVSHQLCELCESETSVHEDDMQDHIAEAHPDADRALIDTLNKPEGDS